MLWSWALLTVVEGDDEDGGAAAMTHTDQVAYTPELNPIPISRDYSFSIHMYSIYTKLCKAVGRLVSIVSAKRSSRLDHVHVLDHRLHLQWHRAPLLTPAPPPLLSGGVQPQKRGVVDRRFEDRRLRLEPAAGSAAPPVHATRWQQRAHESVRDLQRDRWRPELEGILLTCSSMRRSTCRRRARCW